MVSIFDLCMASERRCNHVWTNTWTSLVWIFDERTEVFTSFFFPIPPCIIHYCTYVLPKTWCMTRFWTLSLIHCEYSHWPRVYLSVLLPYSITVASRAAAYHWARCPVSRCQLAVCGVTSSVGVSPPLPWQRTTNIDTGAAQRPANPCLLIMYRAALITAAICIP